MAQNATPNKAVGSVIPAGVIAVDPISGIAATSNHAKYTQITTSGTTTVSPNPCVAYGGIVSVLATATGAIYFLDGTTTLAGTSTATAVNQAFGPAAAATGNNGLGLGVRCQTSLIVVTSGTNANTWNILWD